MYVIIGRVIMGIVPQLGNITLLCFYSWNLSRATFEEGTEPLWDHFYVSNTSPFVGKDATTISTCLFQKGWTILLQSPMTSEQVHINVSNKHN
jgi:hypothetical protein